MASSGELQYSKPHVLVIPYPLQGHINPMLLFAKRLASKEIMVTFVTTEENRERMLQVQDAEPGASNSSMEVKFETISDGLPVDFDRSKDLGMLHDMLRKIGALTLPNLIERLSAQGNKISCIVYDSFLDWVPDVAKKFNIPVAFFWTQSCAVYSIYDNFTRGGLGMFLFTKPVLANLLDETGKTVDAIEITGLPLLKVSDLPTFLHPSNTDGSLFLMDQFKPLPEATWVLGNSFSELEWDEINSMKSIAPIRTVGPLIPSAFLDRQNPGDTDPGAHLWKTTNCMDWLSTKAPASVVYVSFGSLTVLSKEQIHEIALGLKTSGYPFLWVIRGEINSEETLPAGFLTQTSGQGLVVPWCRQLQMLSHSSVGAFMTHCGWNSTLESLSLGVPMLTVPQWSDQTTNSAYIVEKWKAGMRLCKRLENGLVGKEEVEKCIKIVMESQLGAELRKNALQWKKLSKEAMVKGGSSDKNIQEFVEAVIDRAWRSSSSGPDYVI
eukprot:PITA_10749